MFYHWCAQRLWEHPGTSWAAHGITQADEVHPEQEKWDEGSVQRGQQAGGWGGSEDVLLVRATPEHRAEQRTQARRHLLTCPGT